jgi:hypothetical protein
MTMNTASLSYLFLGIGLISFIFFCYFKVIHWNTSDKSSKKDKIIGKMKNPDQWRSKNNRMSYVFLFWSIISLGIFIYLKYFVGASLVSGLYVIGFLAAVVITSAIAGMGRKSKA